MLHMVVNIIFTIAEFVAFFAILIRLWELICLLSSETTKDKGQSDLFEINISARVTSQLLKETEIYNKTVE